MKQITAYKYNNIEKKWEPKTFTPTIEIPDDGIMSARDLEKRAKITSLNGKLYASESERDHREELMRGTHESDTFAFLNRIDDGLTANFNPIFLCPQTGCVVGGNTTTQTLYDIANNDDNEYTLDDIKAKVEYAPYIFDEDCPDDEKMKKLFEMNKTGKRDEMSVSAIYDRVTTFMKPFLIQNPWVSGGSSYRTDFWKSKFKEQLSWFKDEDFPMDTKKLKWIMDLYTLPEELKSDFEKRKKNLDWTSCEKLLQDLKREKNAKKENPNKFNFVKLFEDNLEMKENWEKTVVGSITQCKDFFTRIDKQGNIIPNYHTEKGVKSCSIASTISHKTMFESPVVFENIKDETLRNRLKCVTESAKKVSGKDTVIPDLAFPNLSKEYLKEDKNYDKATIEIKVGTYKDNPEDVTFYGGPGFRMITETPYLFVCIDRKLTRCLVILKNLNKKLVSSSSTVKLKDILNREGDYVVIVGSKKNNRISYERI